MILLFNPRSANSKPRIPNSILTVAASVDGIYDYTIVDGNMESDPGVTILEHLKDPSYKYFGCTCMPGPQLKQAIPISKKIKELYPHITIIWGGYFASNQSKVVLDSEFIDFIINGPGDKSFPALIDA